MEARVKPAHDESRSMASHKKFLRNFGPLLAAAIEHRLFAVLRAVCSIPRAISQDALAPAPERLMPEAQKGSLDRPHVFPRKPPIIAAQPAQIEEPISGETPGEVDVRIEIAPGERAQRTKDRLSAMQAWITRARHGAPTAALAVNKDDVVEVIDRFEAHHERRIAVLLKNTGGHQRGLEAMRPPVAQNLTKASERFGIRSSFSIIRQAVEKALHQNRGAQPPDQAPLGRCKDGRRRWRKLHHTPCSPAVGVAHG